MQWQKLAFVMRKAGHVLSSGSSSNSLYRFKCVICFPWHCTMFQWSNFLHQVSNCIGVFVMVLCWEYCCVPLASILYGWWKLHSSRNLQTQFRYYIASHTIYRRCQFAKYKWNMSASDDTVNARRSSQIHWNPLKTIK